jgi:hypothetical protein
MLCRRLCRRLPPPVGKNAHPDSSSTNNSLNNNSRSSPARRRRTTTTTTAVTAATTVVVAPATPLSTRVHGPPTSTLGLTLFKCGRVPGGGWHPATSPVSVTMLAGALPYGPPQQVGPPLTPSLVPLPMHHGQQLTPAPPSLAAWSTWMGSWDQQLLANSFNTMALVPPAVADWVADSSTFNHTTSDVGNLTSIHPHHTNDPSSIAKGSNILVTPDIIQNLLSVRHFTTDNWCSMEFDHFGLSLKDLST